MQRGQLFKVGGSWYVRYYEGGKRRTKTLAKVVDYPTERKVEPLLHEFMKEVNRAASMPGMDLATFIRAKYLPWAKLHMRPSTYNGYEKLLSGYSEFIEPKLRVREYRVADAQALLQSIAEGRKLTSCTLGHIKAFFSGVFGYATQCGLREYNPMPETRLPRAAKASKETYAYSGEEIGKMLPAMPLHLRAAIATSFYAGLRLAELHGLQWDDYDGENIYVRRSVWRDQASDPKTLKSKDYVPVTPPLRAILEAYAASGTRSGRLWTLDLGKSAQRVLGPLLKGLGMHWYGWHALRRGCGTEVYSVTGGDLKIVQRALRHSRPMVTAEHYVKTRDSRLDDAMLKLAEIAKELPSA